MYACACTPLGRPGIIRPLEGMDLPITRVVIREREAVIVRGHPVDHPLFTQRCRTVSVFDPANPRWTGLTLSLLRVVTALVFMQHGSQKLFHYPPSGAPGPVVPFNLMSQTGIAGILEFFGGMLILFGFLTRPVAFLLCGEMAVAYFQVHAPRGLLPIVNRGELAVMMCFVFLYFVFAGAGPWSVDALIAGRKAPNR